MASLPLLFPPKRHIAQAIVAAAACMQLDSHAAPDSSCRSGDAACLRPPARMLPANDLKDLIPADDDDAPPSLSNGLPSLVPSDDDDALPALGGEDGLRSLVPKESETPKLRGFLQQETAYTYASPAHFSPR